VVSYGTPAAIKADLVEEYVIVDADDRPTLLAELDHLGLPHAGAGPFRIALDGRGTHAVLKSIDTPLSVVQTHLPSLEDAYMEIVGRTDA
jgi:ABC-2 type transport system ATP-binding protein